MIRRLLTAVVLSSLATACGSTVAQQRTLEVSGGLTAPGIRDDLGQPGVARPVDGGQTGTAPTGRQAQAGSGAHPDADAPSPVTTGAPDVRTVGRVGPGITPTTVKVGIIYSDNANAANEAYGVQGAPESLDPRRLYRQAFEEQNRRGGIQGRRLVPVFFNVDSNSGFATQMQAACSAFTEDDHVFAVFGGYFVDDTLRACLHRKGVVVLLSGISVADQRTFDRFPAYVEVSMMNLTRGAALVADRLAATGFLGPRSRIGLVTFDEEGYRRARDHGTKAALARHGLRVASEATIPIAWTTDQVGRQGAAISGVVLKFKQAQVDRVLFVESSGDIALLFMTAAEAQRYRPDYGLGSGDGGALLAANVPSTQLDGAKGVGWLPVLDVGADQDPDAKAPQTRRRCLSLFAARGERFDRSQYVLPLGICDQVWFLARGTAGGALNRDAFATAVSSLGQGYESTLAFLTRYGVGKHDGGDAYRDFGYVTSCTCYRWTSGVRRLG